MIKRFLTYILAFSALGSCSDDFDMPQRGLDEDGNLTLSFSVAPLKTVATRAGDAFSSVTMYVYDTNSGEELQVKPLTVTGGTSYVAIDKKVLDATKTPVFYFVANQTSVTAPEQGTAKSKLENSTTTALDDGTNFTLSSKAYSLSELMSATAPTISMFHNAVKLSVTAGEGTGKDQYGEGSVKYSFCAVGTAQSSLLLAGGLNSTSSPSSYTDSQINGIGLSTDEKFVHPTDNTTEGLANKTFVIVKANYKAKENDPGKDYFYRLDFQEKEGTGNNTKTKAIDLEPNHWYQFLIKSVNGVGFDTPSEAAKNPSPMIEYAIHDHAPVIYNMISDGMRELGVSESLTNENKTPHTEEAPNQKVISVKLYSPISKEMDELKMENWKNYIIIPKECDWLEVSDISLASTSDHGTDGFDESYNEEGDEAGNKNSKGKVYDVTLNFTDTKTPGTQETDITINWHGLSRPVHIKWNRDFDATKLFSPDVKIKAFSGDNTAPKWADKNEWTGNTNPIIYFKNFLGQGLPTGQTGLSVGTSPTQNNGMARDAGLHFPLMYGKDGDDGTFKNKWTYMYEVSINPDVADGEDFTWTVSAEGVSNVKFTTDDGETEKTSGGKTENKTDCVFYVTRKNKTNSEGKVEDWDYEVGKLHIYIKVGTAEAVDYPIDLYHTGFFHKDEDEDGCIKGGVNGKYTYYEVITVGEDHWLDRNIGAKSAQMYIEGGYGPSEAAGYYLVAAKYNAYKDPEMYTKITPPGYEVPSVEQWNNLRQSSNFNTELAGAYYNAYYQTNLGIGAHNPTGKRVYFPKARYYEGSSSTSLIGNSRSGYYWSCDAAYGTEKEEKGNWLQCLTMSGNSTSYMRGKVKGKGAGTDNEVQPFYMSLRAVAQRLTDSTVKHFSFQVEGATHIYLYTVDGSNKRTPVTTWPGQAIGTYNTMTIGQPFPFVHESKTATEDNLYVIFNFVDKSGRIYTMSNNEFANEAAHRSINADDANGWLVVGSKRDADFNKSGCGVSVNTEITGSSTTWICSAPYENTTYKCRIYWPNDLKVTNTSNYVDQIYMWAGSWDTGWNNGKGNASEIDGYLCYDFEISETNISNSDFYYILRKDTSKSDDQKTEYKVEDVFGKNLKAINVAWVESNSDGSYKLNCKKRPSPKKETINYRLYWRRKSSADNVDGNYWKVEIFDGENNSLIASKTDKANWDGNGGWYYIDFTIKDYADNLKNRTIRPEFFGGTGKRYIKNTNGGKISLSISSGSVWENKNGTYTYGKNYGQLSENDITEK